MPSKHLISLTQHGGEAPILQYAPMCQAWAVTTYDACDIRCSYCHSLSQGVSRPKASAAEVRQILERDLPAVPREHVISLSPMIDCTPTPRPSTRSPEPPSRCSWPTGASSPSRRRARWSSGTWTSSGRATS